MSSIFRREAIDYHDQSRSEREVLLIFPHWGRWTYRLLVTMVIAGLALLTFGSAAEYAEGPAIIQGVEQLTISADGPGVVSSVRVGPGAHVARSDVLASLRLPEDETRLRSLQRNLDWALLRILRNPADRITPAELASLAAERDLLAAPIGERLVRSPEAGIVGEIHVTIGQRIAAGDPIADVRHSRGRFSVLAMLPGQQSPMLHEGQLLRLELNGYPYTYQNLTVEQVGRQIVGQAEVRRMLGLGAADTIPLRGPVVIVRATPPTDTFLANGQAYRYVDGMQATARARIRSDRLLNIVVPGVKLFTEAQ
jgi:multidrug efflux pump subunit AcrA (membrane-fusion protein)